MVPHDSPSGEAITGPHVLIVEDMGMIAQELRWMLEECGCHVVGVAARIDKAIAMAQSAVLDGVLLDVNLSGVSSHRLADILRLRGIPCIVISGYDPSRLPPEFAGNPFLQKPFGLEELATVVKRTFTPRTNAAEPHPR